jgi:hypothetical protein
MFSATAPAHRAKGGLLGEPEYQAQLSPAERRNGRTGLCARGFNFVLRFLN